MKKCSGSIDSIESFSTKDGPGIRTVIFLNGCNLRCKFCHNPEMFNKKNNNINSDELIEKIRRFKSYYGDNGGVTFSGGEPLLQSDFILEVSKKLKKENINIAIETAGAVDNNYEELIEYIDLVIIDIKAYNEDEYKNITGFSMERFNKFLKTVQKHNKKLWIRQVIIPGLNDSEKYILGLKEYISKIKNVEKIELLPYHTMAIDKYEKLNLKYRLDNKAMDKVECKKLEKIVNGDE